MDIHRIDPSMVMAINFMMPPVIAAAVLEALMEAMAKSSTDHDTRLTKTP